MKQLICLLVFVVSLAGNGLAQTTADSLGIPADTVRVADSQLLSDTPVVIPTVLVKRPLLQTDSSWTLAADDLVAGPKLQWLILAHHPIYRFEFKPVDGVRRADLTDKGEVRVAKDKDLLFYSLLLLIIVFALLRRAFPKYFNDLFRLFFRTTLKERQISEQLMQTPVPSVLLNGFFAVSAGFYCTFLLLHFGLNPTGEFWTLFIYCTGGLAAAYFIKFTGLKISGWIFNLQAAANSYIFIVFIINKMIGILLLPFLLVLAFSTGTVYTVGMTLSWCLIGGLMLYRLFLTYAVIRNQVKVSPFHFFLYFLAFEIAPLLLVYKALLVFFSENT
ncbi:MAG TPA: DUF4271 domain-containing protein [Chitinophagaceae bacterium]|nr:DUF4271 domain-containing protein [Chitinophagaceae bacterium]